MQFVPCTDDGDGSSVGASAGDVQCGGGRGRWCHGSDQRRPVVADHQCCGLGFILSNTGNRQSSGLSAAFLLLFNFIPHVFLFGV